MSLMTLMAAAAQTKVLVENVFSTNLYSGNGSTETVVNGLNLSGHGGLVWTKYRSGSPGHSNHDLYDSARGDNVLYSNTDDAQAAGDDIDFNGDGYTVKSATRNNISGISYVGWSFRRARKFFDVVSWTGNAVAGRQIAHDLGSAPGCILVKKTNAADNWVVWHKSLDPSYNGYLNDITVAFSALGDIEQSPAASYFLIEDTSKVNAAGDSYVAYVFADEADGVVQCGSYTGNASASGPSVNLGWQPQWLLIRKAGSGQNWIVWDTVRDVSNPRSTVLFPNSTAIEDSGGSYDIDFTATGFQIKSAASTINATATEYIFIAIRAEGV